MRNDQKALRACLLASALLLGSVALRQDLGAQVIPVQYEELTAPDFVKAVEESNCTCIIPMGIIEKHGPHLPLGTDLLDARETAIRAAKREYAIVYPHYYFGQIFEAKHQPGTVAYSSKVIWDLLQETCDELSRNGIKKIILYSGHGGNSNFVRYFCNAQLEKRRDYAVYLFTPTSDSAAAASVKALRRTRDDGHAGENETSAMLVVRPDLVRIDQAKSQSGENQNRLGNLQNSFLGIWWYARYPNHYAGDGSQASRELGEVLLNNQVDQLVRMIREVKQDENALRLQRQFFDEAERPLETEQ
ncbi:MAG: creatininase [Ignavibacteriales bacterium CG07_land_8_20_14_0_80_59_12]|nr:MAG: creatininase [Ignavibacteriales bacterium CG07_land_8_20_14_0_80_59_12]